MGEWHDFWGDDMDDEDEDGKTGWERLEEQGADDYAMYEMKPEQKKRIAVANSGTGCLVLIVAIPVTIITLITAIV